MSDLFCAANLVVVQNSVVAGGSGAERAPVPTDERFAAVWCGAGAEAASREVAARLGVPVTVRADLDSPSGLAPALQELADLFRGETVLLVADSVEQARSFEAIVPAVEGLDLGPRR